MSTAAVTPDPYAAYGGQATTAADPYAAYGGSAVQSAPPQNQEAPGLLDRAQRAFDNLTTVTPDQEKGHSWLTNKAQEFGAGAIQGAGAPIVHPLQTLEGVGNMIAHPIDTATSMAKAAWQNPAQAAGNLVGGAVLGEGAAAGAGALNSAVSPVVGRAALLGKTPAEAYESALKPSTTLSQAERQSIVKTGLENEIPVSKQGLRDIGRAIDNINQSVKDTIAADPNRPIDPNAVATRADLAKAKFSKQVNAQGDLDAIDASKRQFLNEQGGTATQPAPPMSAADAQAMKQGTYRVLSGKFGEQGSASVEAQKALARGLKEEIATQFPQLSNLNAQESKLLDLQPVLERAVNRSSNHQLMGIGTPIAASAGAALTGSSPAGAIAGALKMALDNPMVKSRLAIALSKGAKIPYAQAVARVGAYSSTLGAYSGATQQTSGDQTPTQ